MNSFQPFDDLVVCVGFPGEEHSLREFVTPGQPMVAKVRAEIEAMEGDFAFNCWDWVCKRIKYPLNWLGLFVDRHEMKSFGRSLYSYGEFFQFPYQTLLVRIGDCFDTSALLASLLRPRVRNVWVAVGSFRGVSVLDHAWVVVRSGDRDYILETTLTGAASWKSHQELPEYEAGVFFNDSSVMSRLDGDELFCHCNVNYASRVAEIRRCWNGGR